MLKKSFYSIFFSFFFMLFLLCCGDFFFCMDFIFLDLFVSSFNSPIFGLMMGSEFLYFSIMVFLVTSMVVLFGEMYMEHYNNKKFFFLTMSFLFFMLSLSFSSSGLILMFGWDGLGISSLLLIMFYPGKLPLYNSFLTFFFNRLGDSILMFILILSFFSPSSFSVFSFFDLHYNFMFWLFFFLCSLTKSAQFPFSSWLPAAMSAPTPISAMVHSSTLVTAGIYLLYKSSSNLEKSELIFFLIFLGGLTFVLGGLLSNLEKDFKKIVAFSTMSQISMVIFFLGLGYMYLSISHMLFHSLFKTLLFCSCGVVFLYTLSDQNSCEINWYNYFVCALPAFIVSLYSMSGFPFSSSFFSKDMFMESLISSNEFWKLMSVILGSFLTLLYSSKILSSLTNIILPHSSKYSKNSMFFFFWLFCLLTMTYNYIFEMFYHYPVSPNIHSFDSNLILYLFLMVLILKLNLNFKILSILSFEIFFSKNFIFGFSMKYFFKKKEFIFFSDQIFFKPFMTSFLMTNFNKNQKWNLFILISFLFLKF